MAIKFEDDTAEKRPPAGKIPAPPAKASVDDTGHPAEVPPELPFGKPVRPEKKRKAR